jgi:hypothetical protein
MTKLLFRNRWFALAWAIALCFSIARFFDVGGGQQELQEKAAEIRAARAQPQPPVQQADDPEPSPPLEPVELAEPAEVAQDAQPEGESSPLPQQGLAEQPAY